MKSIILGGGCFWCIEAIFQQVPGVTKVISGYSGGHIKSPTYYEVSSGLTGHAEVVKIEYDEMKVSVKDLLEIFFEVHDATTLNQQGADIGTQYRSAIYYESDNDRAIINEVLASLNNSKITTEIKKLSEFYEAEDYHQNYYHDNASAPYCRIVISPKLEKLQKILSK